MKKIISLVGPLILIVIVCSAGLHGQKISDTSMGHAEWLGNALKEIETIKPGMNRRGLVRLFVPEGGLGNSDGFKTYLYRDCPYIKVDVEFEAVKRKDMPDDKIIKISRPYLGNPTID